MKTIQKITIALIFLVALSNITVKAQIVDICAGSEQIKLKAGNFQYGTIEWEYSYDNVNWIKIEGAKDTVYTFLPTETKYYRAVNKFSECQPQYSEVSFVQMPVNANAGSDRTIPGNSLVMTANLKNGETAAWSVFSGNGGSFTDVTDPYSEFTGDINSTYKLIWQVTNACGTDQDTINVTFKENTYIEPLVIVDETDTLYSTQAQLDAGEYIIKFSAPVPNITDTTVLIGLINDGFLRKVNSFTQNGDTFTMQTEQSSLDKITEDGAYDVAQAFNIDTTLTDKKISNYHKLGHMPTRAELLSDPKFKTGNYYYIVKSKPVYMRPGVTMKKTKNKGGGVLINLDFNKTILSSGNVNLNLNGNYTFTPNIKADLDYQGLHLNSFKMGMYNATIERNYELALTASGSANLLDQDFTLMSVNKDIVIILGGVPVWIRAEFKIDGQISADVSSSMDITHQFKKTSTYTSAIKYEQGQWQYIYNESDNIQTNNNFTVTGDLTQNFDIGPNLTFKIYGIVGPYIDAQLTEELQLCFYNDNWNANMEIGGQLSLGAKAEILATTLFDVSKTWSQSFYNLKFPYQLEIISGNNQNYELGNPLSANIKSKVISNKGFGVPYALVHFEPQNGGSVENSFVIADANGYAETSWTPGGTGQSKLEAYILDCDETHINTIVFTANEKDCSQSSLSLIVTKSGNTIQPLAFLGVMPYTYSDDGINFNSIPPQIVPTAGKTYIFFAKDSLGCLASATYTTPDTCENSNLQINLTTNSNVIEAIAGGGTLPYQYALDGHFFTSVRRFTNVSVGTHTVYVQDANTCTAFATTEVTDFGTVTDIDGNVYPTVVIGTQEWMAENLKVTHYPNGDPIPHGIDNSLWSFFYWGDDTTGVYCYYNNNANGEADTYGALYSYTAFLAKDFRQEQIQGVCPDGWHIPSVAEWNTLRDNGGKLKEAGTIHWYNPNSCATNETGFTALPGGFRDYDGFFGLHTSGFWWANVLGDAVEVEKLLRDDCKLIDDGIPGLNGYSVRCVRDH